MKEDKINVFFISVFPPPYHGVGVWNERIFRVLESKEDIELTVYSPRQKRFLKTAKINKNVSVLKKMSCIIYTYASLLKDLKKRNIGFKDYLSTLKFLDKIVSILTQFDTEKRYILYLSHSNLFSLAILYVFEFLGGSKIILHEHGSGAIEYAAKRPKAVAHIFNRVDRVLVASKYMKSVCIEDGCESNKIYVLPCGINVLDKPYPEKENIIMFCGSLEIQKDPITFIKAIPIVLESLKTFNLQFVFIGEGSLRGEIEKEAKRLGIEKYVRLYGELPNHEVLMYYQKTKIFVLPSIREPFGIVLIEAMSNYTPCIVTRIGGMPEVVDQSYGRIVNKKSPEELAAAIVEIMQKDENEYQEMGMKAFAASKQYDMSEIGELFYHQLLQLDC